MKIFKRTEFDRKSIECAKLETLPKDKISTGSKSLDSLLGGGIPLNLITHIYGPAGSGKTNICLSAAVQCASAGSKVLYIDTEGGFNLERLDQIIGKRELAKNIILRQPLDFQEQKSVVRGLARILNPEFDLLVMDSIVSLYRLEITGERKNILELSRELGRELAWLSILARQNKFAVIICNQVYESFNNKLKSRKEFVPVGGDTLLYWSKIILELENDSKPGYRIATLRKHPSLPEGRSTKFKIVKTGLE